MFIVIEHLLSDIYFLNIKFLNRVTIITSSKILSILILIVLNYKIFNIGFNRDITINYSLTPVSSIPIPF